tara:strand:- start:1363 stop:1890 length:528 start_codon:yes stop_codon:yes gene_type:complete
MVIEYERYGEGRLSYGTSIGYNYGMRMIENAYPISSPLPIGALNNNGICVGVLGKLRLAKSLAKFQPYLGFDIEYTHARGNLIYGVYIAEDVNYHRIKPRLSLNFRWDFENNFFLESFIGVGFSMHLEQGLYDKIELVGSYYTNEYDHLSGSRTFGILNLQIGVRIGIWKDKNKD